MTTTRTPPPDALPLSPLLGYAELPSRHGVVVERGPHGLRLVIPTPPWRQVFRMFPAGSVAVATVIVGGNAVRVVIKLFGGANWVPPALYAAAMTGAVVVFARLLLSRRTTIEVTPTALRVATWMPWVKEQVLSWDRPTLRDVRYVAHSRKLVVHAHGREMTELGPSYDPELMKWLADTVREALDVPAPDALSPTYTPRRDP